MPSRTFNYAAPNIRTITETGTLEDGQKLGFTPVGVGVPIITAGVTASGTLDFAANAADGDTVPAINSVTGIVFKISPGAFPEIQLGLTRAASIANLAGALNLAVGSNPILWANLAFATYEAEATDLLITAVDAGTGGNSISLGASTANITRSGATLTGGVDAIYDPAGSSTNPLKTSLSGDIEIGAVEIKNATDDTRAVVKTDGTNNALVVTQNAQPLPTLAATSTIQATQQTSLDAINAVAGTTAGAAVVTDANGTLQQYLRGIVKLLITSGTIILGAGTNAIGKLAANSGVDIGDVDVTSIAAGANTIGNTKDAGPSWTSVHGVSSVPFTSADATTAASVSDSPTAGQKLVLTDLIMSSDTALSLTIRCETSNVVIAGPFYLAAGSSLQVTPRSKAWKTATADKKLQVIASLAGNISVDAHYYSEA